LSLYLRSVISQITPGSDRRLILFDPRHELDLALFENAQVPVHFFLPNHRLTSRWDLVGGDFASPAAVGRLCDALVPRLQGDHASTFFVQALRALMGGVIRSLNATQPAWSLADVIRILDDRDSTAEVLARRDETRSLLGFMDEPRTYATIAAAAEAHLDPLRDLAAMWSQASQVFSLREFVQGEGILVLGSDPEFPALDLLNMLLFTELVSQLLAQSDSSTRRTYLVFDELTAAAGEDRPLPGLRDICERGAPCGVVVAATFQSYADMKAIYKDETDAILGMLQNRVFLRAGDIATAKYASQQFGLTDEWVKGLSWSRGQAPHRPTTSRPWLVRDVVPYDQFLALPPASPQGGITGYWLSPPLWRSAEPFHLPGSWIAANLPRPASRAQTF
jgi:hypothetical protein